MTYTPRYDKDDKVTTSGIDAGAVTSTEIKDKEVKTADIGDNQVTAEKIQPGAIHTRHLSRKVIEDLQLLEIPDGSISGDKIDDHTITHEQLADSSVTHRKLAANSVGQAQLMHNAVTSPKIAIGAVSPEKLSFTPVFRPIEPGVMATEIAMGALESPHLSEELIAWLDARYAPHP